MNAKLWITFALSMSLLAIVGTLRAKEATPGNPAPSHMTVAKPQENVIYVDKDAPGPAHDGLAWTTAYADVQQALTTAISGTEIWVAEGVYYPGAYVTSTFALTNGVALYGGFAATETLRTQRDWMVYITVLSGDIDRNDITDSHGVVTTTTHITGTNAYHVVTGSGTDGAAVLDGFTITAGKAEGLAPHDCGAGMYNSGGSPTLTNMAFSGNDAENMGGGMCNNQSSPTLTNVTFSGNGAKNMGGGMYSNGGSPTLTNVTFSDNWADLGGGMYNIGGSPTLANVTFSDNGAYYGGGMYNDEGSPTLMSVTFSGNRAHLGYFGRIVYGGFGGGMLDTGGSPTLTNVIFSGNEAYAEGGGMLNYGNGPTLTNVTFSGNKAGSGGGVFNDEGSPTLTNVIFSGNLAGNGGGMYNYTSSPTLTNVTFSGNSAGTGGGMLNYNNSNPMLVNSILCGNRATYSGDEISNDNNTPVVTYSDVCGPSGVYAGTGNINADPLFVAPITATAAPTTMGNYRLRWDSPAIDAGNTLSVTALTDLDGQPRIRGAAVDMGAYELGPNVTLAKFATPSVVTAGQALTYTLQVFNTGGMSLHAVVTDILPEHITPTGILTWTPIITAPGDVWTYSFVVTLEAGYTETLINTAQVTADEGVNDTAIAITNGKMIYLPLMLREGQ